MNLINPILLTPIQTSEDSTDNQSADVGPTIKRHRSRSPPGRESTVHNEPPAEVRPVPGANRSESGREAQQKSPDRGLDWKKERARKCLPPIKDKHLTVCSSTLWLGHVPKTVSEADISDAFGEFGTITSIDVSILFV